MVNRERRLLRLALEALVVIAVSVGAHFATESPRLALISGIAAIVAIGAMRVSGVRGLIAGTAFFGVAPGIYGEASLIASVSALITVVVVALTYRVDRDVPTWRIAVLGMAFLGLAIGAAIVGGLLVGMPALIAGVAAVLAMTRRRFARDAIVGLGFVLAALTASYAVTLAAGFADARTGTLETAGRSLETYWPLTLATGGPPWFDGTRRFSPLVGEPGLAVFLLAPLLALLLTAQMSRLSRVASLAAVAAAAVFTQSVGVAVGLALGLAAHVAVRLFVERRRRISALVWTVVSTTTAALALSSVLEFKGALAGESLADRGLGSASNAGVGGINLIVAATNYPAMAACIGAGIVLLGAAIMPSSPAALAFVAFAFTAVASQPSQWHTGAWLLVVLAAALAPAASPASAESPRRQAQRSRYRRERPLSMRATP